MQVLKKGNPMIKNMMVYVKFCGNCNPKISSRDLVNKINEMLEHENTVRLSDSEIEKAAIVLVISACPVDCAARPEGDYFEVVVAGESLDQCYCESKELASKTVELILKNITTSD